MSATMMPVLCSLIGARYQKTNREANRNNTQKKGSADTLPKGDTATVESLSVSDVITIMKDNEGNDYHVL